NVRPWAEQFTSNNDGPLGLQICNRYARELWAGAAATIGDSFSTAPTTEDAIRLIDCAPPPHVKRLRDLCAERVGKGRAFAQAVGELSALGQILGENPTLSPWFLNAQRERPFEDEYATRADNTAAWLQSFTQKNAACTLLELSESRCNACRQKGMAEANYDCATMASMQASWNHRTKTWLVRILGAAGVIVLFIWGIRLRRAKARHGAWLDETRAHLASLGLVAQADRLRYVFPSRLSHFTVKLPDSAGGERIGTVAVVMRVTRPQLQDGDVNHAARLGQRYGASLALLVHDENTSPDLGAVRAMLEWAARGGTKAVHVVPLPWSRLKWSAGALDLLELAEEASLRSNPFEVRGRVTSSSQFFDRERLVSGLLASAQAGHFCVVTGLRRFGKSSLALEVG